LWQWGYKVSAITNTDISVYVVFIVSDRAFLAAVWRRCHSFVNYQKSFSSNSHFPDIIFWLFCVFLMLWHSSESNWNNIFFRFRLPLRYSDQMAIKMHSDNSPEDNTVCNILMHAAHQSFYENTLCKFTLSLLFEPRISCKTSLLQKITLCRLFSK